MSIGNSIYDTLVGVYNTLDNAQEIICSPQLSSLRNAFMGKPAFIVSNGPSLDRNIDTLTRAVGKSLIITAESSLRPCLIRGIRPDAVAVTERTPNVYHIHFENQRLPSDLVLIGLTLIDPRIPKLFQGSFVPVFRSGESSCRWIQQTLTDDVCGLHSGSSSAHLAFEFAVWTGANPIVFVGQDLAFGRDKTTHSQLSAYAESTLAHQVKSLREQPAFYVPGVNGERVLTTRLWDEFRAWFEDQISLHPEVHFIDATEGGAYIHGTELMTLDEVVSTYCTEYVDTALYQYVQSASVLPNTSEIAKKYSTLLSKVKDMKNQFHSLTQSANDDIQDCRLVELACQLKAKHPETEVPSFIEALVERSSVACEKFTDVQIAPYTQHALFAFHKQINDLGEVDSVDSLYLATRLYRDMYECLKKICAVMTQQFDLAERHVIQKSEIDHT
ncbi:motility associated factor glycosyltransferase family protein [Alicyclobacillus fastidiosus]|nr:6-hydroxymethylpterin diphosphokinase MptE-like protein [Alicyclobacillus fastidiosus]GMA61007.1 hypothetical protein GCM10025859_14470 [Alicyclobacillus fastidiosus]